MDCKVVLGEVKRLHGRVGVVWSQKKKYLESARKSHDNILEIQQKGSNWARDKLVLKMNSHISKVLTEYTPTLDELFALRTRSKQCLADLS